MLKKVDQHEPLEIDIKIWMRVERWSASTSVWSMKSRRELQLVVVQQTPLPPIPDTVVKLVVYLVLHFKNMLYTVQDISNLVY